MTRLILATAALALLVGCSSADDRFEKSCRKMAKAADDMTKDEQKAFCGCLTERTADMDKKARKEVTKLMQSTNEDNRLDKQLEEAIEKGRLDEADGRLLFSALKGCSVDLAM